MNAELYHHGIKGQKHGVRHGPPYPLKYGGKSLGSLPVKKRRSILADTVNVLGGDVSLNLKESRRARMVYENRKAHEKYKKRQEKEKRNPGVKNALKTQRAREEFAASVTRVKEAKAQVDDTIRMFRASGYTVKSYETEVIANKTPMMVAHLLAGPFGSIGIRHIQLASGWGVEKGKQYVVGIDKRKRYV